MTLRSPADGYQHTVEYLHRQLRSSVGTGEPPTDRNQQTAEYLHPESDTEIISMNWSTSADRNQQMEYLYRYTEISRHWSTSSGQKPAYGGVPPPLH